MFINTRLSSIFSRRARKENVTMAIATAGLVAVAASSPFWMTTDSEPAPVAVQQTAPAPRSAPSAAAPAPALSPASAAAPLPVQLILPFTPPAPVYPNNLDGWIREALDIMRAKGIPGSYHGIHRNIMRESTGNPRAINLWDSNAAKGTPSKGLLQVIDPTFAAYHVKGTVYDIWNPVSNIVAACNYAAHRYGSMDNVNGAY